MTFNYSKLRGRIVEKYGNQSGFSQQMGMSEHTLSKKMTGKVSWKQPEIVRACDVLDISACDIPLYFFTNKVQQS